MNKQIKFNKNIPSISVRKYTKKIKNFVITKDTSFDVGHKVIHGFIGPNGSGKTTVMKAMIGAYTPTQGEIFINGYKAGSIKANGLIGYIPEKSSLPQHLNALQYLTFMGEFSGLKAKEAKEKAQIILKSLKLTTHAHTKSTNFSLGMQKKMLLAQSLLTDPKILILDEPTTNLDPAARKDFWVKLEKMRSQGKTIFISSHILTELERIVDEVTFIYCGEIIFSGSIKLLQKLASNVFIKTTNNKKLAQMLQNKGYEIKGSIKTEIELIKIARNQIDKLFNFLTKTKITILSLRVNDLQSIYDKLIEQSISEKRGSQKVLNQKIFKKGSK